MSDTNVLLSLVGVIIMQCTNHSISPSGNCSKKEYEKIIEQIISNIQSGNYKVGDKLPAERDWLLPFPQVEILQERLFASLKTWEL